MIPIDGQPILTAAGMRATERASGHDTHALMQHAGAAVAQAVARLAGNNEILILCGPGNNGGDGYVAAARLAAAGHKVRVAAGGAPAGDAAIAARAAWGGAVESLTDAAPAPVVIDALFGTGLSRPIADELMAPLRRLLAHAHLTIAVDLPSGVVTDDGMLLSDHPGVDVTLALAAVKPAHVLLPAAGRCGAVRLLDIGVAVDSAANVMATPHLSAPAIDAHKYTRGMVAVVAGRMVGAAALAATAAAHTCGYVLLLGSATDRLPHAIVRRRWTPDALADRRIGGVVIGPGLGRNDDAATKLDAALASDHPLVIDGDAIHLISPARARGRAAPVVLTPHQGEFDAAFGAGDGSRIDRAHAAAIATGATIVLKGPDTVVAHPDGRTRVAQRGIPWLATAGTGDVLAGTIGGLLAAGHAPMDAASGGVWLHAAAARFAGPAFIADDLIRFLPDAIGSAL